MTDSILQKRRRAMRRCADARDRLRLMAPVRGTEWAAPLVAAATAALEAIAALDAATADRTERVSAGQTVTVAK